MTSKYTLNKLARDILDAFPDINNGGCCVFAALIAKQLQHYYPVRILAFGKKPTTSIDYARSKVKKNNCREWGRNDIDLYHIVVEFCDEDGVFYHYDTTGVHNSLGSIREDLKKIPGSFAIQEACELASDFRGWNTDFDRRNIPNIDKVIKKHFNIPIDNRWSVDSVLRSSSVGLFQEHYYTQLLMS